MLGTRRDADMCFIGVDSDKTYVAIKVSFIPMRGPLAASNAGSHTISNRVKSTM
jgi:hypothetical protein